MKNNTSKAYPLTAAEQRISDRFHLSAETARLIAERAGLRSGHDDWQALALVVVTAPPPPVREDRRHV